MPLFNEREPRASGDEHFSCCGMPGALAWVGGDSLAAARIFDEVGPGLLSPRRRLLGARGGDAVERRLRGRVLG